MNVTNQPVDDFLSSLPSKQRRIDSRTLIDLMREITGEEPKMWGLSIIGFGHLHYAYESGHEGDTMVVGFAPRKNALVLYGVVYYDQNLNLAERLGKHKTGKGCLYISKLADVDLEILKEMIEVAYKNRHSL